MPKFRRRTTPKLTLFLNQNKKQLQKSPQHGQNKSKRMRLILLFVVAVVTLQVILLRSVSIQNQIHEEITNTFSDQDAVRISEPRKAKPLASVQSESATTIKQDSQVNGAATNSAVLSESSLLLYSKPVQPDDFPQWIQDYVKWHQQVRQEFPGMQLFENPNAPPLLIRTCLGLCGGLHDRIGQLPWDLYLARKTKRLLLIAWQRPRSLENFLLPPSEGDLLVDWRVPEQAKFGFDDIRRVRNETELFKGFPEANPTDEFFQQDFDAALERATVGSYSKIRILRFRFLGHLHQGVLEERLQKEELLRSDDPSLLHTAPLFGKIFWLFFRPSPPVHAKFSKVMEKLQLLPQAYTAVHCRVRHPKAFSYGATVLGKNPAYPADKTGLPWEGETRQAALGVALKALQCAKSLSSGVANANTNANGSGNKVYFLSDSNDLVSHIVQELPSSAADSSTSKNWTLPELQELVGSTKHANGLEVLSRDPMEENAHIDRQKGRPPEAYYDTFVDLLVVMHAQCVVYGIGYYAAFGAKVSGTTCQYLYQKEAWGAQAMKGAEICPDG
ncbi:MAG: hypothetical protein SGBAC_005535 [Bacillariaceae sp.]